jgi:hypothetical protein
MVLLPSNITVFALDFSGSGISGGQHVTLGWNEVSACSISYSYLIGINPSGAEFVLR